MSKKIRWGIEFKLELKSKKSSLIEETKGYKTKEMTSHVVKIRNILIIYLFDNSHHVFNCNDGPLIHAVLFNKWWLCLIVFFLSGICVWSYVKTRPFFMLGNPTWCVELQRYHSKYGFTWFTWFESNRVTFTGGPPLHEYKPHGKSRRLPLS